MQHPITHYKSALFQHCVKYAMDRIETARSAMESAQEAANSEEKSSAGDKYETNRAMMQMERDKAAQQLDEALKLKRILDNIKDVQQPKVEAGSIVHCQQVSFYVAISAGKIKINDIEFIAIAPNAPIASLLIGKKVGDTFRFDGKDHVIDLIG